MRRDSLPPRRSLLLGLAAVPVLHVPLPPPRPIPRRERIRVFLLRGFAVGGYLFSQGLDRLAKTIERTFANVEASVHWNEEWPFLGRRAETIYNERDRRLILIGHSAGADNALRIAAAIAPIPVALLVTIDPTRSAPGVSDNVERFLNLYLGDSMLGGRSFRADAFRGRFEQVDLRASRLLHVTLDKSPLVQAMILERIGEVAGG